MKKIFLCILLVLIIGIVVYIKNYKPLNISPDIVQTTKVPVSKCGLTVLSPLPQDAIDFSSDFSFVVKGVVDNTKRKELGCSWSVFEAQAASMKVVNTDNEVVGNGLLMAKDTDWMTDQPVQYEGVVKVTGTHKGFKLIVTEENPSGEGNVDTIEIPLIDGSTCDGC
jgi:hypothetical protein